MGRKIKTSITVDPALWEEFTVFVLRKKGRSRRLSAEVENALREYLRRHGGAR